MFGMGTGGSLRLLSPEIIMLFLISASLARLRIQAQQLAARRIRNPIRRLPADWGVQHPENYTGIDL